jgi:hypothetical protein
LVSGFAKVPSGVGIELKAVPFPLKQFAKKSLAFVALLRMDEIAKAERWCAFPPVAEHFFQGRIERGDVSLPLALRQTEGCVLEKRTRFRFRILWCPRELTGNAHTLTLREMIPGRNLESRRRPWFS